MRVFKAQAIILRRTNYGEADRILNLLTAERGKISVIAKGVRKSKSKLAGGLELFATSEVTVHEGRGDMGLVTSARLVRFYANILHDYDRMQLGYELVKKINQATETVGGEEFYYLLRDAFAYLDALSIDYRLVELWFYLQLAALLGRGVNVARDVQGVPLAVAKRYNFDFSEMSFVEHPSGQFDAERLKLLRLALAKDPAILRQISGVGEALEDCLWLVRAVEQ